MHISCGSSFPPRFSTGGTDCAMGEEVGTEGNEACEGKLGAECDGLWRGGSGPVGLERCTADFGIEGGTGFAFDAVPYLAKYSSAVSRSSRKLRAPSAVF